MKEQDNVFWLIQVSYQLTKHTGIWNLSSFHFCQDDDYCDYPWKWRLSNLTTHLIIFGIMFYIQYVPRFCENKHMHNSYISCIVFMLFVFSYFLSCDTLHCIDFTLFIITTVFSYVLILYYLFHTYPVTICCGKAQFPERDHLISPSSPHKAPLSGYSILCLLLEFIVL